MTSGVLRLRCRGGEGRFLGGFRQGGRGGGWFAVGRKRRCWRGMVLCPCCIQGEDLDGEVEYEMLGVKKFGAGSASITSRIQP